MIIKLFNSETGDESFVDINNNDTFLELNNTIIKDICDKYEKEYGYGCTIYGLIKYIKDMGYNAYLIRVLNIEFNH